MRGVFHDPRRPRELLPILCTMFATGENVGGADLSLASNLDGPWDEARLLRKRRRGNETVDRAA
jgi:hypothetical protein